MTRAVPLTEATPPSSHALVVHVQRFQYPRQQPTVEWAAAPQAAPVIANAA